MNDNEYTEKNIQAYMKELEQINQNKKNKGEF